VRRNFLRSLGAVLGGAAIYWPLMRHLPPWAQHHLYQADAGLLIFALISLVLLLLLMWLDRP
jgi:hypothetical protein